MRKYILMQVICLLMMGAYAQSDVFSRRNPYTYIFKLDSAQVALINKRGLFDTAFYFTHKADSFLQNMPVLKPGYYLSARAADRNLFLNIVYIPHVQLRIAAFNDKVQVRLFDTLWNSTQALRFYLSGKEIAYDTTCQCYSFDRSRKTRTFFMRMKDGFVSGNVSGDHKTYPPEPSYNNNYKPAISLGYFITNQPLYHVKDTVKMKAYILKPDGHAFTKNLLLYVKENFSPYRKVLLAEVKPLSRGAYVYDFAIPDTFKTDRTYLLYFEGKDGALLKETYFKTEDYKLRNATYSAVMDKALYRLSEPMIIKLKATDANELPLTQARARIQLRMLSNDQVKEPELFIPDSWYQNFYETWRELEISGPTEIELPAGIFPQMTMNMLAEISFSDPSGELSVQQINFTRRPDSNYYTFTHRHDFMELHAYEMGNEVNRKYIVQGLLGGKVMRSDTVTSPWQQFAHPNCDAYTLTDSNGRTLEYISLSGEPVPMSISGIRTHDSIHISLYNPGQYEVYYQLYRNKKVISEGVVKELDIHKTDTSMFSYNLVYIYTRRGQTILQEQVYTFKEKHLELSTNMPSQIYPGQTVPLDILVMNAERKPQPYVNLTAYGVNAQFENIRTPYLPYYGAEDERVLLRERTDIIVAPQTGYAINLGTVSYHTLLKGGFMGQNDYRLRFPDERVFEARIPLQYGGTEFTPFVVANGKKLGIYCIEIDGEPVFIQPRNYDQTNFSFRIQPGKHLISVRTQTAWFYIQRTFPRDSSHYVFSFDTLCLPEGIRKVAAGSITGFTPEEWEKIEDHMLVLEPRVLEKYCRGFVVQKNNVKCIEKIVVWDLNNKSGKRFLILGPLAHDSLQLYLDHLPVSNLKFSAGKQYTYYRESWIEEDRDTVDLPYELKFFRYFAEDFNAVYDTLAQAPAPKPAAAPEAEQKNDVSYAIDELEEKCIMPDAYLPEVNFVSQSRILIQGLPPEKVYGIYFIHKTREENSVMLHILPGNPVPFLNTLDTGLYDMFILLRNGSLYHRKLVMKPAGVLVLNLLPQDFKGNCNMLLPYKTLARELKELADFRNKQLINYRASDYVSIRQRTDLQYSISKYAGGQISGVVVNNRGEALSNVVVTLEKNGKIMGISFTDISGGFLIRNIQAGSYEMRLTRYGNCVTMIKEVPVKNKNVLTLNIILGNCGFSSDNDNPTPVLFESSRKISAQTKEEFKESKEPILEGTGIIRGNVVDAANRKPVDFVSLTLRRNGVAVRSCLTDDEGYYILKNLEPGQYELYASFVGYNSVSISNIEVHADEDRFVNFSMTQSSSGSLQEVVVMYKQPLVEPGGVKGYANSQSEVQALGTRSVNSMAGSLYGVDSRSSATPDFRGSRADGTAYYIDGVRVSNAFVGKNEMGVTQVNAGGLPASFADEQKQRLQNMAGNSDVTEERKDFRDYSFWIPNMVTDYKGEAHVSITFPDNITRWRNFILAMDEELNTAVHSFDVKSFKPLSAQLYVPDFMVRTDEIKIRGRLINYTGDTLQLKTRFMWDMQDADWQTVSCGVARVMSKQVSAGAQDTIAAGFKLETDFNYRDGEKYRVPVMDNRTEKNTFNGYVLNHDTTILVSTDTLSEHTLSVLSTRIHLMKMMIKQLEEYRYGCVEQTTSKLNALLISQKLCRMVKDTFRDQEQIRFCIKRLESQQQNNGTWGWFRGSSEEMWLTHYVMQTLFMAQKMGYTSKAVKPCVKHLSQRYANFFAHDRIMALDILFEAREDIDFENALSAINEESLQLADRVIFTRLKQKLNLPHFSGFVFKGITRDKTGKVYWNYAGQGIYYSSLLMNYQVYEMLKADQADSALLAGLRKYVFDDAIFGSNHYLNTLERSRLLSAMLADEAAISKKSTYGVVKLNGKILANEYPSEIKLEKGKTYEIAHSGAEVSLFVKHHRREVSPAADSSWMRISAVFVQDRKPADTLRNSLPVSYVVNLKANKSTEFVMVQIPIPAGFVYRQKTQTFGADEAEYHKDRIILFYRKWYAGERTLQIELEPRFSGNLTLLPVTAENMYDPQIAGNNKMRRVIVTD